MNKHLHRIIFNAARGQRMVVAETAISHGTAGAGGSDASAKTFTARLTKIGLAVGLACGLALALLAPFVVHAQIKADTTAPGTQRPVILQTGNGVPLVNIATPSAAGVSRNVFSQFDVQPNGVILNNVRSNAAKTTIGGYVQANPFLASGAARVILNEVNSSNPTYLNGPTEVAGSRAEVVIANPSGIRVNGGTFLNASGVTLTTGTPVLSGGNLDAFLVRRGTVDISGLGLDASTADYTRILARAMEVNAGLWAQHLTVVTGTNEVKALASGANATTTQIVGTGAAPGFMLDVGAIGGMYAGHIYLVGTEAGLGVNNRGAVSAQQGKMVLLANGQLVNQGTIQAKGDVTVSAAGAIDNSGASAVISSQGHLDVTSGSTVSNTGGATVAATGSLSVAAAGSLSNVGTITPANTVVASTIAAHGAVRIRALGIDNTLGTVASVHSTLTLDSQGQSLVNSGATMSSAQAATIDSGALNNDQGLIQTGGALSINTGRQTLTNTNSAGHASGAGGIVANGELLLAAGDLDNSAGYIGTNARLSILSSRLTNTDGDILGGGALDVSATEGLANLRGNIQSAAQARVDTQASALDNTAGRITAQGALTLRAQDLINDTHAGQGALIASGDSLSVESAALSNGADATAKSIIGAVRNASFTVTSLSNAGVISAATTAVDATGDITNLASGRIEGDTRLRLASGAAISNAGALVSNRQLTATGNTIANSGSMEAADHLITATDTFDNAATGSVTAASTIDIGATTLTNHGLINANESGGTSQAYLHATTIDNLGAGAVFGDHVAIAAQTLNNRPDAGSATAPVIAARRRLDIGITTLSNEDGALLYSGDSAAIGGSLDAVRQATGQATQVKNISAGIETEGDLDIATATLLNERRNVQVQQVASLDSTVNMQLAYWQGNSHQERPITSGHFNYRAYQTYYLDPASIVSIEDYITPDGLKIGKAVVQLAPQDSLFYVASGASGYYPIGQRARQLISAEETRVIYFLWREEGVSNPDQVAGGVAPERGVVSVAEWELDAISYSNAYGRCTTQCIRLVTPLGYTDPEHTIYNRRQHPTQASENEVSRTAHHTARDDVLNASAGAPARISSGGALRLVIGESLTNRYADIQSGESMTVDAPAGRIVNEGQTLYRVHSFYNTTHNYSGSSYDWTNPDISEVIGQLGGAIGTNAALRIDAQSLTNTDLGRATGVPTTGLTFMGASFTSQNAPITVAPNTLFHPASPGQNYLIESDSRFTNYRQWMGSDYMLGALSYDPASVHKRLGDGFYEQKLIREQVAQLTGRRFLESFADDEAQYQALMDAGVTYARQWNLVPGVALTAEQMAALTTDLVWLVEREVILPDGTATRALVPQVYVRRVKDGEITAAGALIAGDDVRINVANDLANTGGTLAAKNLRITAGRDISNIGGVMQATQVLVASAGRDITVASPTISTSFQGRVVTQSRTELARVGTLRVVGDGAGGVMVLSAGRDVNLQAAAIGNASQGGATLIEAGNDLNLTTATTASASRSQFDAGNYYSNSTTQEVGTRIATQGDLTLQAGNDLRARAASVDAGGALAASALRDVVIEDGRATSDSTFGAHSSSRNLVSKKSSTTRDEAHSDTAIGSSFSGNTVDIQAKRDLTVKGSSVISDHGTALGAGRDLTIEAATNTYSSSHFSETRKSGVFSGGGIGVTLGKQQATGTQHSSGTTAAASTVGAIDGDVTLSAGNTYRQSGSDVLAPGGDIDITARRVDITEARETGQSTTTQSFKQSGVTVSVSNPVIDAGQTIGNVARAMGDTGSARMKALGAGAAGLGAYNTYNSLTDKAGNFSPDKATGFSVNVSAGSSKSSTTTTETTDTARGSRVGAGGDVSIVVSGQGEGSDLRVRGSDVAAGHQATLRADGDVILESAQDSATYSQNSSSRSASVGMSAGFGAGTTGLGFNASASRGSGSGAGQDVAHTNTHVTGGDSVSVRSGGDTDLRGAAVAAPQVTLDVGGDLAIESRQDTSSYHASSKSAGGSISFSPAGVPTGGSVSAGRTRTDSEYASVGETSGIQAGDGGFDVRVKGDTDLHGGVIASTDKAVEKGRNRFETGGTLTTTDIQNRADYSASGWSASASYSAAGKDSNGNTIDAKPGGSAGIGSDSGSASSTTRSGISGIAGDEAVRSTDGTSGIGRIFDRERVEREVNAQVTITAEFGKQASKAVGDYATRRYNELKDTDPEEAAKWAEGGIYRVLAHTTIGALTGGTAGAAGAGMAALSADYINQLTAELPEGVRQAIGAGLAAGLGAAVGGYAGATSAFNTDVNNRQLHPTEKELARKLAARSGGKYTAEQIEEQMRLMGNVAFGELPNTMTVLTNLQSIQDSIAQDPSMPKTAYGNAVVEVPGQYDADIQQYIIANTQENAGWIPGSSPYSPSAPSVVQTPQGAKDVPTARCANGDVDCIAGIGRESRKDLPLTAEEQRAAGEYFGQLSTNYQRIAGLMTATGNVQYALVFEVASGVASLLEQALLPSTGKVMIDSIALDLAAKEFSTATGIPLVVVNEAIEHTIKPRLENARKWIDRQTGIKK